MRSIEELQRVAFREQLTGEEDDLLADHFQQRSEAEASPTNRLAPLKQAAFFASRAFDKGVREPEKLSKYLRILTDAQKAAPSDSFRRKLAEVKSTAAGKDSRGAILKKLGRQGTGGNKSVLATDAQLVAIQADLGVKLPPAYRMYLCQYAHRQIGTFEPYLASELVSAVREAWNYGLEPHLLPFLEDNADHYCFDLRSKVEEPPVVFRPHDGTSTETWPNFEAWVEECWLGELED
jgi:hypothetical protein